MKMTLEVQGDEPSLGYYFVDQKKNAFSQRKITLHDKDDKVVAICLQAKAINLGRKKEGWYVYGMNPMYDGHRAKVVDGIDTPVYEWMNVRAYDNSPYYEISSYMNQKPYEPLRLKGKPVKMMSGMNRGVVLTTKDGKNNVAKLFHKKFISNDLSEGNVTGWDMTIAPGVDPLPIVCITAIMDHTEGQNF